MADKQIKTIVDHIGRTVVGKVEKDTKDSITLFYIIPFPKFYHFTIRNDHPIDSKNHRECMI